MENKITYENHKHYLLIKIKGERNSTLDLSNGTEAILTLTKKLGHSHLLLDYREVAFNVKINEAFNLVRLYENKFYEFKYITIATVVSKKHFEITAYWAQLCQKRGFNNMAFTSIQEAKDWIVDQSKKSSK